MNRTWFRRRVVAAASPCHRSVGWARPAGLGRDQTEAGRRTWTVPGPAEETLFPRPAPVYLAPPS